MVAADPGQVGDGAGDGDDLVARVSGHLARFVNEIFIWIIEAIRFTAASNQKVGRKQNPPRKGVICVIVK